VLCESDTLTFPPYPLPIGTMHYTIDMLSAPFFLGL
jgi:hypothetical protein